MKYALMSLAKIHGYTYQGKWEGMHHFSKRIDEMSKGCLKTRFKCLKCMDVDIDKGAINWMLENGLSRE